MCLGSPMQVVAVTGAVARCAADGQARDVSLLLLSDAAIRPGDWVLVQSGCAMRRLEEGEALGITRLLHQVLGAGQS